MGYTTPKTWAYKEVLSSSDLNTYVKDNIAYLNDSKIGMVVDFAGSSAPTGWLICNGATISQATYAALYAIIGHTYGADPGGGNFILPDCRGKATVGYKSADGDFGALGNVAAGEKTHLLTGVESGEKGHAHPIPCGDVAGGFYDGLAGRGNATESYTATIAAANAANAHNNIQPSIVFNKIIKY
jgi:microcystin-dependent protein